MRPRNFTADDDAPRVASIYSEVEDRAFQALKITPRNYVRSVEELPDELAAMLSSKRQPTIKQQNSIDQHVERMKRELRKRRAWLMQRFDVLIVAETPTLPE